MAKKLLDRFLGQAVRKGSLELQRPDGSVTRFGTSEAGYPDVRIRFTTPAAERRILLEAARSSGGGG